MQTPEFDEDWFNPNANLPYGVTPEEVKIAIREFYDFYDDLNRFLMREDHGRIETVLRANNALSDFIGNVATEELAQASDSLTINQKQDGFPDILPVDHDGYAEQNYEVHHGDHGIETKCSKSNGGWQAHNNEEAWFVVFRYERGDPEVDLQDMEPIRLVQVLAASLNEDDWSHSGRSGDSRRTITSSIISSGMYKLRSNPIYEDPEAITGRGEELVEYKQRHASFNPKFAEENPEYVTEQTKLGKAGK
ncbi:hypothetical protein HALLA_05790 [Halostagnicola larsenii XH-48]|uniref:Uncharacterized protein n=1 Tax=Halostagnicola larsenii XH-48 TaxID=797299 RepID=W0JUK9_9EURY|nr:hypothetical protein [Halostagnicola larsenii]AHG00728.1 hypothetical protein HALLA_05790 [Halostagnicola larsenii XH-48]